MAKKQSPLRWGILGALGGAIAGLLFAPQSGKETRQDIKTGADKAQREAKKQYGNAKREVSRGGKRAKTTAKQYARKTKRAAKRAAADVKDEFSSR